MMTAGQYEQSLKRLNMKVYMFGKRVVHYVFNPLAEHVDFHI